MFEAIAEVKKLRRRSRALTLAAALATLSVPVMGATFDTAPGGGSDLILNLGSFDWGPSSVIADQGNQAFVNFLNNSALSLPCLSTPAATSDGCVFDVYAHGKLIAFSDPNNTTIPSKLGDEYEITYILGFSEKVVLHPTIYAPVFGFGPEGALAPPYSLVMSNVTTPNFFRMYIDTAKNADPLSGTGYDDGTLILETRVQPKDYFVSRFVPTGAAPGIGGNLGVTPPEWEVDNTMVGTSTGSGSSSVISVLAEIVYIDQDFFPGQNLDILVMSNIAQDLPFLDTDPSLEFPERPIALGGTLNALTGVAGNPPYINGSTSGSPPGMVADNPDFMFQTDPVSPLATSRETGGQGCTPGYWKQEHHFFAWTLPYTPLTPFEDVFEDAFGDKTLLAVLWQGGGGLKALGRHTVAALLNAASPDVSYPLTVQQVIDDFDEAFLSGDASQIEALKNWLDELNNAGCPLGNGKDLAVPLVSQENNGNKGRNNRNKKK